MERGKKIFPPNPKETANCFSRLSFFWTIPMFVIGYKRPLELEDMYETLKEDRSHKLGDTLEWYYFQDEQRCAAKRKAAGITDPSVGPRPSLARTLFRTFWMEIVFLGLLAFINEAVIKLSNPVLLGHLLQYFRPESTVSHSAALAYAGGIVFLTGLGALAMNHYVLGAFHLGMRARVAVCSLIYRKSLRLSRNALGESPPGKVVNLLSNDVNRFDMTSAFLHYIWVAPAAGLVTLYFLWQVVGLAGLLGMLILLTVVPVQAYTGRLSARFRLQTAMKTDERARFMGEIISGVQVIKMYAWEIPFQALIALSRRLELKMVRKNNFVRAVFMSFLLTTTRISMFFVMVFMTLFGYKLTSATVFAVATYFSLMAQSISSMFTRAIAEAAEAYIALRRLQNYLDLEEIGQESLSDTPKANGFQENGIKPHKTNGYINKGFDNDYIIPFGDKDSQKIDSFIDTYTKKAVYKNGDISDKKISESIDSKYADTTKENGNINDKKKHVNFENKSKIIDNKVMDKDNKVVNKDNESINDDHMDVEKAVGDFSGDSDAEGDEDDDKFEEGIAVKMMKAQARWIRGKPLTLDVDHLEVPRGKLVAIIGPVGSGKSSLLQALLRELPLLRGTLEITGSVSYAAQESWVFGGSVRQNILFGQSYDKFRYNEVVRVCALQRDFEQLPFGDQTIVGEKGSSLSGGQRARINLARAVYRQADIYLLDDPLSAVDAHVGRHLFTQCIAAHLRHSTRVLVTHQLHYLKDAHHIVLLRDGKIEMQGTYHEMSTSSLQYARLLIPTNHIIPEKTIDEIKNEKKIRRTLVKFEPRNSISDQNSISSAVDVDLNFNANESDIEIEEDGLTINKEQYAIAEASSKNIVKGSVGLQYLRAGTNWFSLVLLIGMFLAAQAFVSMADFWMSFWTSQEETRDYYSQMEYLNHTASARDLYSNNSFHNPLTSFDNLEKYTHVNVTHVITKNSAWLKPPELESLMSTHTHMCIYAGILIMALFITLLRSFTFFDFAMRASQKLHDLMFRGIVRAQMMFFNLNPSGRILNRFAKDMGSVDEFLPRVLLDASQILLQMVGTITLACYVNVYFLIPISILGFIFMLLRKVYLKTSKNVKRMEGIARSPVFVHLSATLQGLATIRAFGAQKILKSEFDYYQDIHTSAWYMFITTSSAFGQLLDVMCLILVAIVTFSFLLVTTNMFGAKVGLAITQCINLTTSVQWGIRQTAEVANNLMSVERVLEYKLLPPETGIEPDEIDKKSKTPESLKIMAVDYKKPHEDWPEFGHIVFKNLCMKYTDKSEDCYVIRELSCEFKPKEKIGIVGRTGAGKSSLISALFRLAFNEGSVVIDGIDTKDISLTSLRKKISIIPQDPVLFSGTLRRNLDPFEEYSDAAVWRALDAVELKEALSKSGGLDSNVMDQGSNFSVGQRQLLCLARAVLRNNRLLMLDEATANVDPYTDNLIQRTIRDNFVDCTVLTVAHRLNTIMDSDKVLVMDQGKMVEFDHPYVLLQNEDGFLSKMAAETGQQNYDLLMSVAKDTYAQKNTSEIRL